VAEPLVAELRFDNRVAVITGAGRGLGRSYALLLASRGAKIVVNDSGGSMKGGDVDAGPATEVVREIQAAGGEAVASTHSVAAPEGGQAIIQTALDHYGRIDILIHNAAFPIMCDAGYGRIVLTSSIGGLYGNRNIANYAVSKAAMIGLSNVAAIEGAAEGIKSNCIIPAAVTRMAEGIDTSVYPPMSPDLVAPVVAWLAHESCSISGEMLVSIAGRVARAVIAESPGVYRAQWSIEQVAYDMDAIRSTAEPMVFAVVPKGHAEHIGYSFKMAKG
jgi:NAD(P)-dependent dehydrogenase (short-subunit alcohol dehydrogenase family)